MASDQAPNALFQRMRAERDQEIVLRLLEHVAEDEDVSQAKFARKAGIAKGLANAYFNRCLQKGWIKLRQVPKQRFLYYLTPRGFAEKADLTAQFLTYSFQFYRKARADLGAIMLKAASDGDRRLAILGDGELAEIAAIVSEETPAEIVGFVATGGRRDRIAGRPVVRDWSGIKDADAALLATLEDVKPVYEAFTAANPGVTVYVPDQLYALVWDASGGPAR